MLEVDELKVVIHSYLCNYAQQWSRRHIHHTLWGGKLKPINLGH